MARPAEILRQRAGRLFREERGDLALLAGISAGIVVVWAALFGWSAGEYLAGGDSLGLDLNIYLQFLREGGEWRNVVYRPGILGGANLHDVWGSNLYYLLAAKLGVAPKECFNSFVFVTQISLAFFGVRFLRPGGLPWNLLRAGLIAFSPFIALRFSQGHYGLVMAMTFFLSSFLFLHDLKTRPFTLTSLAVYAATMLFTFGQQNYQFLFYGALFGGPFLAVALARGLPVRSGRARFAALALLVAACVCVSLPRIAGQLEYALGPDSSRGASEANVIYSYTTATAIDWLSSVFWGLELVPTGRDSFLFHETNYPMGPLLLLPLLLVARRRYALPVAALASAAVAVAFSADVEPFSGWLAGAVPPLRGFRVPERAMLPFLLVLPWMALAGIDEAYLREGGPIGRKDFLNRAAPAFVAAAIAAYASPKLPREILAWAAAAAIVAFAIFPRFLPKVPRRRVLVCAVIALAGAELSAFRERLAPFQTDAQVLRPLEQRKEQILASTGEEVLRPLTRSHFEYRINAVTNKGGVMGISTIEGYSHPTRRFAQLLFALKDRPVNPTAVNFQKFHAGTGFFRAFERLYNIRFLFRAKNRQTVRLEGGFGEAWFSSEVELVEDFPGLARSIHGGVSRERLKIVRSDPMAPEWGPRARFDPACAGEAVGGVLARHGGQEIEIRAATGHDCPLTVSTNYVSRVRARATLASGESRPLEPFPGYGALLSMVVPKGTGSVAIGFPAHEPGWTGVAFWLGWLLLAGSVVLFRRSSGAAGERG